MLSDYSKNCNRCRRLLPAGSFNKNRRFLDGLQSYCRECHKAHNADLYQRNKTNPAWVAKDRERNRQQFKKNGRAAALRKLYGITVRQYEAAYEAVAGLCEICGQKCVTGKTLAVDHDHETGAVRGLLCRKCNSGLGLFNDSTELLKAAAEYLTRSGSEVTAILKESGDCVVNR